MTDRNELTEIIEEVIYSDSLKLAETLNKLHKNVLRFIHDSLEQNVIGSLRAHQTDNLSEMGSLCAHLEKHAIPSFYYDSRNRLKPKYNLTKEGFTLLFNHLSGKSATQARIKVSNQYETELKRAKEALHSRERPPVKVPLLPGTLLTPEQIRERYTPKEIHDYGLDRHHTPNIIDQVRRDGGFTHRGKFYPAKLNPPRKD